MKILSSSTALALLLLINGCTGNLSRKDLGLINLDLETLAQNEVSLGLSDLARKIEYIRLETLPEALLNPTRIIYRNGNIVVLNRNGSVHLFDSEGRFIRQIGQIGGGPDEYLGAQYMELSADGSLIHLYFTRGRSCYTYDLDGNKVGSFQLAYNSWRFAPIGQGKHMMISPYGAFSTDSLPFLFFVQDETGQVIRKYPSTKVMMMMGDFSIGNFFVTPKRVLAYQPFCDTVFSVDDQGGLKPAYLLDSGSHRAPDEFYDDMNEVMELAKDYFISPTLTETSDLLFIRFRRLNKYEYGLYDFKKGEIRSIKTVNNRMSNNLDGGPDFWPSGSDGDKVVYQTILPVDLLNPDKRLTNNQIKISDPAAGEHYGKMLNTIKVDDNPILMVVTLK
ncbi:MAG: 6-bladed beta-propeller [Bacteroidales bacterium]